MNLSETFIRRPVATTLLTFAIALAGAIAFFKLPVSPLPQVDLPTIQVSATLPGASPETVATSLATPLERHLGQIADVTEMTSQSSVSQARITLQFALNRNIDGAARDVQAAINAAAADLPSSLRSNPTYKKINPADAPIMILAMTSATRSPGQLYDSAASVLAQKLSQVAGVGAVTVGGSSLPAVRIELNPNALSKYGVGPEDVRAALASANANSPKGVIDDGDRRFQIYTNDQAREAAQYRPLVVGYRDNAAIRLTDVGEVLDSVENVRNLGLYNGKDAVLLIISRQPNANIIDVVDRIQAMMPVLQASIPSDIDLTVANERTKTIRASLHDTEKTLLIAVALVVLVVFLFLRNGRATLIPSVAVPVSLIGTFGAMYLLGYSLDNLSLMALTIATGFVVDDAIVMLENITRHVEAGVPRFQAALIGAREVGFTIISMSLSLIAVFIPILLMGGIVGRLFREFALTLSVAILISMVVSLTTTPMMCAVLVRRIPSHQQGRFFRAIERVFEGMLDFYERTLGWALRHPRLMILLLVATIGFNVYLFMIIPKGLFPSQDTGSIVGGVRADQSISFQLMRDKMKQFMQIVNDDPAVDTAVGFTGGGSTNSAFIYVALKPLAERGISADRVIARLRPRLGEVAGAQLFLQPAQDFRAGGRQSNSTYQFTLQSDSLDELYIWAPKLAEALKHIPEVTDVDSDQQQGGLEIKLAVDRDTASRLGLTVQGVDNTLYDAFGQRIVSTIYNALNQYHVIMEVAPQYWQSPETLKSLFVSTVGSAASGTSTTNAVVGTVVASTNGAASSLASIATNEARNAAGNSLANTGRGSASTGAAVSTSSEQMVPLAAFSHFGPGTTPIQVNHQGHFVATTISFNVPVGTSLGVATDAIYRTMADIRVPNSVQGSFAGTAKIFQDSLATQPVLILAALIAVYIVLGVLYESYVHPITILSTLPSAGVGACLALLACDTDFTVIALIGVLLLIGIVKKNAIMMIDFALDAERNHGLNSRDAIFEAALKRFRPILMTTVAAALGALPLALGGGDGAELRRPLGISIFGGLLVSQVLTLYTTPVVYLYLDRFRLWCSRQWRGAPPQLLPSLPAPEPGE
jgi:multidrug efflux pump